MRRRLDEEKKRSAAQSMSQVRREDEAGHNLKERIMPLH
jgi:hypothetical protein